MTQHANMCLGIAETEITPARGIQLAGDIGRFRPMEEVRDPVFAQALVLEHNGKRVCLVTLDLPFVGLKWGEIIRARIAAECGIEPEASILHPLQNHAAPSLGHECVWDEDVFTFSLFVPGALAAIGDNALECCATCSKTEISSPRFLGLSAREQIKGDPRTGSGRRDFARLVHERLARRARPTFLNFPA
jgi:hypothetical protein